VKCSVMVLVTYDVDTGDKAGRRRLHRVAKACENYGQRVQYSVFECIVDPSQLVMLKSVLIDRIDCKKDSIRIYHLGSNWKGRVEHIGAKKAYDPEGILLV
jgi:CRISPR-associated protein Cas2